MARLRRSEFQLGDEVVMISCMSVLAFGCLAAAPQEDEPLDRLITSLGDDQPCVRDSALERLISLGSKAVPKLQKAMLSDDVEVVQRAMVALGELDRVAKLSAVMSVRPPVTLSFHDLPFGRALEEIAAQTGIHFQGEISPPAPSVTAAFDHAPLMEVLDTLAAAVHRQWSFENDQTVAWRRSPPVSRPSSYKGGFKVMLSRIDVYQSWDYQEGRGLLWVYLDACTEPGVRPLVPPTFEVTELRDEENRELARDVPVEESSPQGTRGPAGDAKVGSRYRSNPFMVSHLDRSVRTLSKVAGAAKFLFPLEQEILELDDLCEASTLVRGDLTLVASEIMMNSLRITVTSRIPDPQIGHRLDPDCLVLWDADGSERIRGRDFDVHIDQLTNDTLRYCVEFNDGVSFQTVRLRCKLIESFYEKSVPFEFTDVPLP